MSWETPRLNLLRTRILADFGSAACMGLGFAPEGWLGGDTSLRQRMGRLEPISFFDLLDASLPRFELLDPEGYNAVTVQPSRGCSHRCEHCADSIFLTPRCQLQPVEKGTENRHDIQKTWTCTWRAEDFGRRLMPAFASGTGIPHYWVNLRTGEARGDTVNMAEAGTYAIEMGILSYYTADPTYYQAANTG